MGDPNLPQAENAQPTAVDTIKKRIFRQAALERLSTSEQLDQLVLRSGRGSIAATVAIWVLLCGVMIWSWLGVIPEYATASGLLVSGGGGVMDVAAPASGQLVTLRVTPGEMIVAGQTVAEIEHPELSLKLAHARDRLAEQRDRLAVVTAELEEERRISQALYNQQRAGLPRLLSAARQRRNDLRGILDDQSMLSREGLSTRTSVAELQKLFHDADLQVHEIEAELTRLEIEAFTQEVNRGKALRNAAEAVSSAARVVVELEELLEHAVRVIAVTAGRVIEIKAPVGSFVTQGQAVVSVESDETGLEAVVFLAPTHGRNVRVGHSALLQPANIKREEFGSLIGTVVSVSAFPVTPDGMRAILRNDRLVSQFSAQGAPYLARIALDGDPATPAALRWTAGSGPDSLVGSGSVVSAEIIVRERAPASLILPFLRKHTGLGY